ncbi:neprilysin-4 [Musca domestica]|uniref:Neprilysin-4 n=1 Tax=Musca domestica TaxID=7370 RepID=A0A9J7D4M1_MUSDO|nr:neprilysin-4 [Musca domestica]
MFGTLKWILVLLLLRVSVAWTTSIDPFGDINQRYKQQLLRYAKSAEMRNYMDEDVDPCSDFHQFACGHYKRLNPPNYYPYVNNPFESISNALSRKISVVLRDKTSVDTLAEMKVKNFHESCMNVGILKNTYPEKLREIVEEFGKMPALEDDEIWLTYEFDWLKTIAEIARKYDIRIILGFEVKVDTANSRIHRLHLAMQDLPLGSKLIYTQEHHEVYRKMRQDNIAELLRSLLGLDENSSEKIAHEIFDFESVLAMARTDTNSRTFFTKSLRTVDDVHNKYFPHFDVKRMLTILLGYIPTAKIYDLNSFETERIIAAIQTTPKRVVANYIFFNLLEHFIVMKPKMSDELEHLCLMRTKKYFSNIMDDMVYRKYITPQMEQDVQQMWHTIKASFQRSLDSVKLSWMRPLTRHMAKLKLDAMKLEINSHKEDNFDLEFQNITLNKHDLVANLKEICTWKAQQTRTRLGEKPRPHNEAVMSFSPVYILHENLIKVPVAMLQPYYLWSDSYPNALKFATLGFFISHELIHAFDEEGRLFDANGNNRQWWDFYTQEYFIKGTQCFRSQYQEYIYDGRHLSENLSQSENIADNGGIQLAFDAYSDWYHRSRLNIELEMLPRLNYTGKQLFFIAYAQLWCSSTHPMLRNFVTTMDEHVPDRFRVIGPLSNFLEFSKEFSCDLDTPMNPLEKCVIY